MLVEIFINISMNNQIISNFLLEELEKALENKLIFDKVLSIFALQAQKGLKIPNNIMNTLFNTFL